ncbi:hypothetical protein EON80_26595 [bacterium]|nr:MAG: hypothetical protein EON80_26595 [bacterium]
MVGSMECPLLPDEVMSSTIQYLLIGGYAAAHAATAIRKHDAEGSIVLLTAEDHLPYERPPLSKDLLFEEDFKPEETLAKPQSFYDEQKITVRTGAWVKSIDRAAKTVALENGENLTYENLLLAPGAGVREPKFEGSDYGNVFYLRKLEDSQKIRGAINRGGPAVVIGGSYLGLEIASGCLKKGLDVTVIDSHSGPWSKFASPQLQNWRYDHSLRFRSGGHWFEAEFGAGQRERPRSR